MPDYVADRAAASQWARELIASDPDSWCIFDTETCGLADAEILQVGLLRPDGSVALDSLVRPSFELVIHDYERRLDGRLCIPSNATAIHGITDEIVADAPPLLDLLPQMADTMHGRKVVGFNVPYDFEMLQGCLRRRWTNHDDAKDDSHIQRTDDWMNRATWECVMHEYSRWCGEWSDYRQDYRWQRLPGGNHTAIDDCRATLQVIEKMARGTIR